MLKCFWLGISKSPSLVFIGEVLEEPAKALITLWSRSSHTVTYKTKGHDYKVIQSLICCHFTLLTPRTMNNRHRGHYCIWVCVLSLSLDLILYLSLYVLGSSIAQGTTSTCICLCHLSWRPSPCSSRMWFSTRSGKWTTAPQVLWVKMLLLADKLNKIVHMHTILFRWEFMEKKNTST